MRRALQSAILGMRYTAATSSRGTDLGAPLGLHQALLCTRHLCSYQPWRADQHYPVWEGNNADVHASHDKEWQHMQNYMGFSTIASNHYPRRRGSRVRSFKTEEEAFTGPHGMSKGDCLKREEDTLRIVFYSADGAKPVTTVFKTVLHNKIIIEMKSLHQGNISGTSADSDFLMTDEVLEEHRRRHSRKPEIKIMRNEDRWRPMRVFSDLAIRGTGVFVLDFFLVFFLFYAMICFVK